MQDSASKVFRARQIVTLAGDQPEAFAVIGERIVASGAYAEVSERFPGAEHVDFGDAVVVPGFNDAHMHPSQAAEDLLHVDLSAGKVKSNSDILNVLRQAAENTPAADWLRGSRYDDGKMAEGRVLTRWDLDDVAPDHPVLVTQVAGHWGILNSRALAIAGLDDGSTAPEGGAYGRDATGHLNGILYERALFAFANPSIGGRQSVLPPTGLEEHLVGLRRALQQFHASGLTSIADAAAGPDDIRLYQEAERRGHLSARVNMLVSYAHFDKMRALGVMSGFGSTRLRINGVKAFVDGAIGGRTCLLEEPFEGSDDHGMQTISTQDLSDLVRLVHTAGSRLGVHANGDRAISLLLDQFERAESELPRPDAHHRIEHCTVITDSILRRMQRLGMIAVPFGSYIHYHGGNLKRWYGEKRLERMFAHRSFLDSGVAVAGSSDYPCGPFEPLLAMQSCVTRTGWDGVPLGVSQRISALEALELYTVGSAYASGEQHVKGRLAPGYLADFVVLAENPLEVDPLRLSAIQVKATYVGGDEVWPRHQE
jgi:predicted amidohydrolase YtcJ